MSTVEFLSATEAHEVPFAAIKYFVGFLNDPQAVSNRTYLEFRDPNAGVFEASTSSHRSTATPLDLSGPAP